MFNFIFLDLFERVSSSQKIRKKKNCDEVEDGPPFSWITFASLFLFIVTHNLNRDDVLVRAINAHIY